MQILISYGWHDAHPFFLHKGKQGLKKQLALFMAAMVLFTGY